MPHLLEVTEATRNAVHSNHPRKIPDHPLRPGVVPGGVGYLSAAGREMLYEKLRNMDTETMKNTSYQLLSSSISKIISTVGVAKEAFDSTYASVQEQGDEAPSGPAVSAPNSSEPQDSISFLAKTTQETAAVAGKWAWQGIGSLVSLASQASGQLSKNLRSEQDETNTPTR